MNRFHLLKISAIEALTNTSVKITFDVPELLQKAFSFEAGQYLTLQQDIDNQKVRRAYSICSSMDEPLSVAIKQVPNGIFSTYATSKLSVGDTLEVMPPKGNFIFFHDIFGNKDLLLFAAGSGITPMMSIIKTALSKTNIKIVLVYGNKSKEQTLFFDEIENLQKNYPERFLVHYIFSRKVWNNHLFGRIERATVNFIFNKYADFNLGRYYLCGPEEMVHNVKTILEEKNIEEDKIYTELFSVSQEEEKTLQVEGKVQVTAIIDGFELNFEADKKESLLTAILAHGGDAPYSCQGGVCSSCMAQITHGKAEMVKNQTLTDKEVSEGLTLTCQAHATTDEITVNFDDV